MEDEFKFIFYLVVALIWYFISQRRKILKQKAEQVPTVTRPKTEETPKSVKPVRKTIAEKPVYQKQIKPVLKKQFTYGAESRTPLEKLSGMENMGAEKKMAASARKELVEDASKSFTNIHEQGFEVSEAKDVLDDFDIRKAVIFSEVLRRPEY